MTSWHPIANAPVTPPGGRPELYDLVVDGKRVADCFELAGAWWHRGVRLPDTGDHGPWLVLGRITHWMIRPLPPDPVVERRRAARINGHRVDYTLRKLLEGGFFLVELVPNHSPMGPRQVRRTRLMDRDGAWVQGVAEGTLKSLAHERLVTRAAGAGPADFPVHWVLTIRGRGLAGERAADDRWGVWHTAATGGR